MFSSSLNLSSKQQTSLLSSSLQPKLTDSILIKNDGNSHHEKKPDLPIELMFKIFIYLIHDYESIKSVIQLYTTSRISKAFHAGLNEFIKSVYYKKSKYYNLICSDINFLKKLKDHEKLIDQNLSANDKIKRNICKSVICNIKSSFNDAQAYYGIKFILSKTRHISIDICTGKIGKNLFALNLLSRKKNIESLSIIADSIFYSNFKPFTEKLSQILDNNRQLYAIHYLSLKNSNINNDSAIYQLGMALKDKTVIKLNLSNNNMSEKRAIHFSDYIKHITIETLDISHNQIGDLGLYNIIHSLRKNLKNLNISYNCINPSGAHFLLQKLRSSKTNIELIYLTGNNLIENQFNYKDIKNEKNQDIEFIF